MNGGGSSSSKGVSDDVGMARVLFGLWRFYDQFLPAVRRAMAKGKAPIERRLRDEAKLARWDEQTYYALVESAEKSHRKLSQLVGEYERSVLHQTVGPVIDAALAQANIGSESIMGNIQRMPPV